MQCSLKQSAQYSTSGKSHKRLESFIVLASVFVIIRLGSYANVFASAFDPPTRQF